MIDEVLLHYRQSPCQDDFFDGNMVANRHGYARGCGNGHDSGFAFGEGCGNGYGENEWGLGAPHITLAARDEPEEAPEDPDEDPETHCRD